MQELTDERRQALEALLEFYAEAGVDLAPTTDAGLLALTQAVAALQRDKRL